MSEACSKCGHRMIRANSVLPENTVRHMARGLCGKCYRATTRKPAPYLRATRLHTNPCRYSTDVDEAVVQRLVSGDREIRYTSGEMAEAVAILRASLSVRMTALRLGVTMVTVERYWARKRAA